MTVRMAECSKVLIWVWRIGSLSLSRVLLSIKILSCITVSKFLIATGLTTGRYYGDQNYVTKSKILDFSEEKNFQCLDWIDYPMDAYRVSGGLVGNIAVICGEYECYKVIQNNTVLLGKMKSNFEFLYSAIF